MQTRNVASVVVLGWLGVTAGAALPGCDISSDAPPRQSETPMPLGQQLAPAAVRSPVVIGQAAALELTGFWFPAGVTVDQRRLLVADVKHNRVVQWNHLPGDQRPGDIAIGQRSLASFADGYGGDPAVPCAYKCNAVAAGGGRVLVGDRHGNRVLVWNRAPLESGVPPDFALPADSPRGLWTDGSALVVVAAQQVLVWTRFPSADAPPDAVVGGLSVVDADYGNDTGVSYDGQYLYVSDTARDRILAWKGLPPGGVPPAFVIGGPDGAEGPGPGTLASPKGLAIAAGSLFVADSGHHRVLVFTPVPTAAGAAASAVLGQDSLTAAAQWRELPNYQMRALEWPEGLAATRTQLYVADSYEGAYRVLVFRLQ